MQAPPTAPGTDTEAPSPAAFGLALAFLPPPAAALPTPWLPASDADAVAQAEEEGTVDAVVLHLEEEDDPEAHAAGPADTGKAAGRTPSLPRFHALPSSLHAASASAAAAHSAGVPVAAVPSPCHIGPLSPPASLLSLPPDCTFLLLLLLDAASLASLSRTCRHLAALASGDEASFVWRSVARADVERLPLHERMAFQEPHGRAQDEGGEGPEMQEEEAAAAPATAGPLSRIHGSRLGSPRDLYLLRLKQRRMSQQGHVIEHLRRRELQQQSLAADRSFIRTQLHLECALMIGTPLLLLASSLLLMGADALGADTVGWAAFVPLWLLVLLLLCLGVCMKLLRLKQSHRKRQERLDALAVPPVVVVRVPAPIASRTVALAPTPSSSPSNSGLHLAAPAASMAAPNASAPVSPASASSSSALAVPAPAPALTPAAAAAAARSAAAAQRRRSELARERERRNQRFMAARQSQHDASVAAVGGGGEGVLALMLDAYFDTWEHARVNAARLMLLLLFAVLLCAKHTRAQGEELPYALVFLPLFVLFAFGLLHPLLPRWCIPSDSASRSSFAGSKWQFAASHLARWATWSLLPLLSLALLAAHLDAPSSARAAPSLAQALAPLWMWMWLVAAVLLSLSLHFGAGVVWRAYWWRWRRRGVEEGGLAEGQGLRCCSGWLPLSVDAGLRNARLGCTMLTLLLMLGCVGAFTGLLASRSAQLRSDPPSAVPLPSALLCLPLALALLQCTLLAAASAQQMYAQRAMDCSEVVAARRCPDEREPPLPSGSSP